METTINVLGQMNEVCPNECGNLTGVVIYSYDSDNTEFEDLAVKCTQCNHIEYV